MSSIHQLLQAVKLSGADKKLISETIAEVDRITRIGEACQGPRGAWDPQSLTCALHKAADTALAELEAAPTPERAEKYHHALVRCETAALTQDTIVTALHAPLVRTSAKLLPLVKRIIADAEASARETAATQRAALVAAGVDSTLIAQHDQVIAQKLQALEGELVSAEGNPSHFFEHHGIGID